MWNVGFGGRARPILKDWIRHSHTPILSHSHTPTLSHFHTPTLPQNGGKATFLKVTNTQYTSGNEIAFLFRGRDVSNRPLKGPFKAGVDRNSSKSILQFCSSTQTFLSALNLTEDGKAGHVPRNMIFHHLHCGYLESRFWTSLHSWLEKGRATWDRKLEASRQDSRCINFGT